MSNSNCCFLTCIQISLEAGRSGGLVFPSLEELWMEVCDIVQEAVINSIPKKKKCKKAKWLSEEA